MSTLSTMIGPGKDIAMNNSVNPEQQTQSSESAKKSGGRKRKRAREVAEFIRRELPGAFARYGDLEAVSENFGVSKVEVLAEVALYLLRRPPQPERGASMPVLVRRRA